MSDTKGTENAARLTQEQVDKVAGGDCTGTDIIGIIDGLTNSYDSLVDFTSHVMERVVNSL